MALFACPECGTWLFIQEKLCPICGSEESSVIGNDADLSDWTDESEIEPDHPSIDNIS